jgi:hypothetical protein
MKKLKLLQNLTAASKTSLPQGSPVGTTAQSSHQLSPAPQASPVSPQASSVRHQYHPTQQSHAHYTDVLRSARAALNTLHTSQPPYTTLPSSNTSRHQRPQCMLPAGFMVLTPTTSRDALGLCVPASPSHNITNHTPRSSPTMQSSKSRSRRDNNIYSLRAPPRSTSPRSDNIHQNNSPRRSLTPHRPRQKLSREAVGKIGKDSRLNRWERVLGYVREQRTIALPAIGTVTLSTPSSPTSSTASSTTDESTACSTSQSLTTSSKIPDRKRRAEEIAIIEERNKMLDLLDRAEQDQRSLWSGGSGGTNGVDEFIWSEDEDDDILPMPQAPPPKQPIPEEFCAFSTPTARDAEGIFECEMQVDDIGDSKTVGSNAPSPALLTTPPTRMSTQLNQNRGALSKDRKRPRPKSTPEDHYNQHHRHHSAGFQKGWNQRIVDDMPMLCREIEMARFVGRRMSTAY